MKPFRLIAICIFLAAIPAHAAPCPTPDGCDPALLARRSLAAARISGAPPVIDGRLDEAAWSQAPVATGFIQSRPRPAAPASLRSEARVLVDGEAIYVGLTYFDPEPARILTPLARRDDETISDWAFVEIDSRHDRRSGFSFGVNPRGVQVDGLWTGDTMYDSSWNAVWEAAAHVDARGWTAEFRIPFSQLAFSLPSKTGDNGEEMVWGINFYRNSPGRGETSNWSPRYSSVSGVVSRFNDLRLPAPERVRRLEVTPYTAARAGNDGPGGDRKSSARAGADLKVGLGSSFSLTATLLPDFGQVEADPSQVNLTAFELFQTEQRPFFLEGIDVFRMNTGLAFATRETSFADESPFYSRRVGRAPRGDLPPGATGRLDPRRDGSPGRGEALRPDPGRLDARRLQRGERPRERPDRAIGRRAAGLARGGAGHGHGGAGDPQLRPWRLLVRAVRRRSPPLGPRAGARRPGGERRRGPGSRAPAPFRGRALRDAELGDGEPAGRGPRGDRPRGGSAEPLLPAARRPGSPPGALGHEPRGGRHGDPPLARRRQRPLGSDGAGGVAGVRRQRARLPAQFGLAAARRRLDLPGLPARPPHPRLVRRLQQPRGRLDLGRRAPRPRPRRLDRRRHQHLLDGEARRHPRDVDPLDRLAARRPGAAPPSPHHPRPVDRHRPAQDLLRDARRRRRPGAGERLAVATRHAAGEPPRLRQAPGVGGDHLGDGHRGLAARGARGLARRRPNTGSAA